MKLIIAGGRDFDDYALLERAVDDFKSIFPPSEMLILSGGQRGADRLGEDYAKNRLFNVEVYEADWDTHGKAAGPIRNRKMAELATHCICFWDGKSRGTANMIETAKEFKIPTLVIKY